VQNFVDKFLKHCLLQIFVTFLALSKFNTYVIYFRFRTISKADSFPFYGEKKEKKREKQPLSPMWCVFAALLSTSLEEATIF
jgi:hypothetical protein